MGKKNSRKKRVTVIKTLDEFDDIDKSEKNNIHLAWVKVDLITREASDSESKPIFSFTTVEALESHRKIQGTVDGIKKYFSSVTEQVKSVEELVYTMGE